MKQTDGDWLGNEMAVMAYRAFVFMLGTAALSMVIVLVQWLAGWCH